MRIECGNSGPSARPVIRIPLEVPHYSLAPTDWQRSCIPVTWARSPRAWEACSLMPVATLPTSHRTNPLQRLQLLSSCESTFPWTPNVPSSFTGVP